MRILLDEQLPRRLARHLTGHFAFTVQQRGWAGATNGELLRRPEAAGFDAFIIGDQNRSFQQQLGGLLLRIIVLVARSNNLEDLLPLVPPVLAIIEEVRAGGVRRIGGR